MTSGPSRSAPREPDAGKASPFAVIDLGTTAIRTVIFDPARPPSRRMLEPLVHPLSLGQDTFTRGALLHPTIETAVEAFASAKQVLAGYGIGADAIHAFGTTAVREASNRDAFLDRIYMATGIDVRILHVADVTRYTYWSLLNQFGAKALDRIPAALAVEAGGGSTEVLALAKGRLLFSHTYGLGTLRLGGADRRYGTASASRRDILVSQIDRLIASLRNDLSFRTASHLIALGGDIRLAAREIGVTGENGARMVSVAALGEMAASLLGQPADELVRKYHVSYADAETAAPALMIYARLASSYGLDSILVSSANMRDGLALEIMAGGKPPLSFERQVLRSSAEVARKYNVNMRLARLTERLATQLFDVLEPCHGLDGHERLLLRVAALLHEMGHFVDSRSHHKHAMYLIENTEFFGMSRNDVRMVALIARYHRRARPKPEHAEYYEMNRGDRLTVCKLASLLRVADALAYTSAWENCGIRLDARAHALHIDIDPASDNHLTSVVMSQKTEWFMDLYGLDLKVKVREL